MSRELQEGREQQEPMNHGARESTITRNILRALRGVPGIVVRKRHGSVWATSGDPDLFGCYDGRHFEIEVKRPGAKPTPRQQQRLKEWALAGARVGVAHSVEEALDIVGASRRSR